MKEAIMTEPLEHQIHGIPPGKTKSIFVAAFKLSRWQWAEKLCQYLRDRGFRDVHMDTCPVPQRCI
jgi:hypothetical protein